MAVRPCQLVPRWSCRHSGLRAARSMSTPKNIADPAQLDSQCSAVMMPAVLSWCFAFL